MIIGITLRANDDSLSIKNRYLNYFNRISNKLILLCQSNLDLLSMCDLIVITGGGDIHPFLYNESIKAKLNIYKGEDELDLKIIDYAVKYNIPLLGICRGMQIINVYFNGSLHQDICNHQNVNHTLKAKHISFKTNSYHHQAIKKLGNNLEAFLVTNDGIIEGIYHNNLKIVGVQYHPEFMESKFDLIYLVFLYLSYVSK